MVVILRNQALKMGTGLGEGAIFWGNVAYEDESLGSLVNWSMHSGYFATYFLNLLTPILLMSVYFADILTLSTSSVSVSTNTISFVVENEGTVISLTD
jgi:hypothetical protein